MKPPKCVVVTGEFGDDVIRGIARKLSVWAGAKVYAIRSNGEVYLNPSVAVNAVDFMEEVRKCVNGSGGTVALVPALIQPRSRVASHPAAELSPLRMDRHRGYDAVRRKV